MGRRDLTRPGPSWGTSSSLGAHVPHHGGCVAAQPGPGTERRMKPRPIPSITGMERGTGSEHWAPLVHPR